jgi:2-haloacid dehalogenase
MPTTLERPKYVSFDCLGTLIYFEITSTTRRLLGDRLTEPQIQVFLRQFSKYRLDQVCGEFYAYEQVLHDAYARTCAKWGLEGNEDAGQQLAAAVLSWEPHDDVPAPLKKLGDNYPLVIVSNADTRYLDALVPKLGPDFHAVLDQLGATPDEVLHVSSHTGYDLMPADDLGFTNKVFLDRGYDPESPAYNYTTVKSLDELNSLLGL